MVYSQLHIIASRTIKNSDKFIVNVSSQNPKIGDKIEIRVKAATFCNAIILWAIEYFKPVAIASSYSQLNSNKQDVVIEYKLEAGRLLDDNTANVYVFITPNGTTDVYEYKIALNVQS